VNDPDVIVVGAGPAGMVLALLLSRSGVKVVVLEQATSFVREFRGEVLQPGALRIFGDLGLGERILALAGEFPSGVSVQVERKVFSFDLPSVGVLGAFGTPAIVPQQQLLEVLAGEASKRPEFALVMGCAVRELISDAGRVTGVRGHLHTGGEVELRAPIVVACDGRFSAIRRAAAIDLQGVAVSFDLLWFSTPIPSGSTNRAYVRIMQGELFASFPSRSNRMQVGWLVHKGAYARLRCRPFAECVDHIARHVPNPLRDLIRTTLTGWESLALLPVVSQCARRWALPGILLIGDAAHPMSPAGGQGINVAIYDAVVSARRIVGAIRAGESLDDAAIAIESERRPPVVETQRQQNIVTSTLTLLGPTIAFRMLRALLRIGTWLRIRPSLFRRATHRFLWGYPEVRANRGPWLER
jgi:2-polyprenyl-6-methoxyphenol hydroxylase-like FAD-dependent oxidoreductase